MIVLLKAYRYVWEGGAYCLVLYSLTLFSEKKKACVLLPYARWATSPEYTELKGSQSQMQKAVENWPGSAWGRGAGEE
jgi:hypothetical protein